MMSKEEYLKSAKYSDNVKKLNSLLDAIDIRDKNKLKKFLFETSDFLFAPASAKFHGSEYGGLAEHSIKVAELMLNLTIEAWEINISAESAIICGLCHDLCKCNLYTPNLTKDGSFNKACAWKRDETNDYGHGDKSIFVIWKHLGNEFLTDEEFAIIRWHMYAFDKNFYEHQNYITKYPMIRIFHGCDQIATGLEELKSNLIEE